MYLKTKTHAPILWSSIENILEQAFEKIVGELQQKYSKDGDALIYFTINQNDLINGIRSSVHVLKENTIRGMVQNVMSTFHRYVNSNQNITLNDTFEVFFKIVSGIHVNSAGHRRKAIPLRTLVGTHGQSSRGIQRGGIIDVPVGIESKPDQFKDRCVLVCLVFQYIKFFKPHLYPVVKHLVMKNSSVKKKEVSIETIENEILQFCTETGISPTGPHDLLNTADLFSKQRNCQIIIISSMDGASPSINLFPPKINFEMPRLYFYLKGSHLLCIDNVQCFFRFHKKRICFGCKKFFYCNQYALNAHKCHQLQCCALCYGIRMPPNFWPLFNELLTFCDSSIAGASTEPIHCKRCNHRFQSKKCFDNHWLRCSKHTMPYYCDNCKTFVSVLGRTIDEAKRSHVCGEKLKRCKVCFKVTSESHDCEIEKVKKDESWPIVGVLSMMFQNVSNDGCEKCYILKMNFAKEHNLSIEVLLKHEQYKLIVCNDHKDMQSTILKSNAISIWFEIDRFIFHQQNFLDDNLVLVAEGVSESNRLVQYSNHPLPFVREESKSSKNLSPHLKAFFNSKFQSAEKKFFQFLLSGQASKTVFIVENDLAMLKLLEIFLTFQIQPNVIQKGKKVFCLDIKQFQVKFINFASYVSGNLDSWVKQFNINTLVPYFPDSLNTDYKLNQLEPVTLDFESFLNFGDTKELIENKKTFFQNLPNPVLLKRLLLEVLVQKTSMLLSAVTAYLKQSFELETLIARSLNQLEKNPIHPFNKSIVSNPAFVITICQYFFLNEHSICTVRNPYSSMPASVSLGEYEYTSYLAWKHPSLQIENCFTGPTGQHCFGRIRADAYSPISKQIFHYHGCYHHFHDKSECLDQQLTSRADDERDEKYGKLVREKDKRQDIQTLKMFPEQVKSIDVLWECQWKQFKRDNPSDISMFWTETGLPKDRQLIRLVPRAAVRGGFLETYRLKYVSNESTKISWVDANSLYSHIALNCLLPVGGYEDLNFFQLKNNCHLNATEGQFYYNDESMICDIALVEILAPSGLQRPFLSFRIKDEFVFMANCRTCAEEKQTTPCKHLVKERSFTSTWPVCELAYAVHKLGYKILNWLNVHHYKEAKPLLKDFVKILASQKLKSSNVLAKCSNLSEKQQYCDVINEAMQFDNDLLTLKISNCSDNPIAKNYYKNCLNSLYGRFALHSGNTKHIFCKSFHDIEVHSSNPDTEILDFFSINDNIMEMVIMPNRDLILGNRRSNLYFTAIINAKARIFIYDLAEQLAKDSCKLLSIDTDSICFAHPVNYKFPFQISDAFGHFKHVLSDNCDITAFYSLGVRNYLVLYRDSTGCEKYLTKVKGLSLGSHHTSNLLNPNIFQEFVEKRFDGEVCNFFIPQSRQKIDKQTKTFKYMISAYEFSNEVHIKRFINSNDKTYQTYSYGYDFKNLLVDNNC